MNGVLLQCKYRLFFPSVPALLISIKFCWGVEGWTWAASQQPWKLGGKWKKFHEFLCSLLPFSSSYSLLCMMPFEASEKEFSPLHGMSVSRISLEGAPNCLCLPSSPLCFCWLFVSLPNFSSFSSLVQHCLHLLFRSLQSFLLLKIRHTCREVVSCSTRAWWQWAKP